MAFADEVSARLGLDAAQTRATIGDARYSAAVARLIMPPPVGVPKNWAAYRARFVEPLRLRWGAAFWREHATALERTEAATGVPAWLVVGIIGVETGWGRDMGSFRAVDALATLSFDFPKGRSDRSAFFRDELAALMVLSQKKRVPPDSLLGSYAGAIGIPQFMPSSYLKWAVDADGDGVPDLRKSPTDAIASVGSFLAEHGWVRGLPAHGPVTLADKADLKSLLDPDIAPSFTPDAFALLGASVLPDLAAAVADSVAPGRGADAQGKPLRVATSEAAFGAGKLALVMLENAGREPTYVAGTENFFVITRYNRSSYYALAVIELGQAVAQALGPTSRS
jgi:membrane-bound lytic murein transglycosylase B